MIYLFLFIYFDFVLSHLQESFTECRTIYQYKISEINSMFKFNIRNNQLIAMTSRKSLIFMQDLHHSADEGKIIKQLNFHDSQPPLKLVNEGIEATTEVNDNNQFSFFILYDSKSVYVYNYQQNKIVRQYSKFNKSRIVDAEYNTQDKVTYLYVLFEDCSIFKINLTEVQKKAPPVRVKQEELHEKCLELKKFAATEAKHINVFYVISYSEASKKNYVKAFESDLNKRLAKFTIDGDKMSQSQLIDNSLVLLVDGDIHDIYQAENQKFEKTKQSDIDYNKKAANQFYVVQNPSPQQDENYYLIKHLKKGTTTINYIEKDNYSFKPQFVDFEDDGANNSDDQNDDEDDNDRRRRNLHENEENKEHQNPLSSNQIDTQNTIENYNCDFNYYYMERSFKTNKKKLISFCYKKKEHVFMKYQCKDCIHDDGSKCSPRLEIQSFENQYNIQDYSQFEENKHRQIYFNVGFGIFSFVTILLSLYCILKNANRFKMVHSKDNQQQQNQQQMQPVQQVNQTLNTTINQTLGVMTNQTENSPKVNKNKQKIVFKSKPQEINKDYKEKAKDLDEIQID